MPGHCGVIKEIGDFGYKVFIAGKTPFIVDMRDVFEQLDHYAFLMAGYSNDYVVAMYRYADEITGFLVNAFSTHILRKYTMLNGEYDEELGMFLLSMYRRRFIDEFMETLSMSFDCYVEEDGYDEPTDFGVSQSELQDWLIRRKR